MKRLKGGVTCTCAECKGSGYIPCPDCEGSGSWHGSIDSVHLTRAMRNHDGLVDLQSTALLCKRQAKELTELMPRNAARYASELAAIIEDLNEKASKLSEKPE